MKDVNLELLAFCVLWAALAFFGGLSAGWGAGFGLTAGLFALLLLTSGMILSRTGNFALERGVRWGILIIAALILFSYLDAAV